MKYLVTGVTGSLGKLIVERLLEIIPASQLAVSVRDVEKALDLVEKGVDVRFGNFDQPASLEKAFAGVERLLIISTTGENRLAHQKAAVEAAQKASVKYIGYTSVANAHNASSEFNDHYETEQFIKATNLPHTFLRNNWYVENEAISMQAVMQGTPWVNAIGSAKVGWAARKDYAHAAANVLTQKGHEFKTYELSGELLTTHELAKIVESVIGKEVIVQDVDIDEFGKILAADGMPT